MLQKEIDRSADDAEWLRKNVEKWGSMRAWEEWVLSAIYHYNRPTEEEFRSAFFGSFGQEPTQEEFEHIQHTRLNGSTTDRR